MKKTKNFDFDAVTNFDFDAFIATFNNTRNNQTNPGVLAYIAAMEDAKDLNLAIAAFYAVITDFSKKNKTVSAPSTEHTASADEIVKQATHSTAPPYTNSHFFSADKQRSKTANVDEYCGFKPGFLINHRF